MPKASGFPSNPFESAGLWLRAALHTHTTGSDGAWSPAQTAERYREARYDVLVISDHGKVTDVTGLSGEDLLVLPGQEMHPHGNRGILYHLLAVNLPETVPGVELEPREAVERAAARGALVYKAHPAWCGLTAADVAELEGLTGIEVWNATCLRHCKPSSEALWDELLTAGRPLPAIATDDCHHPTPDAFFPGDFDRGWTMIRAASRDAGAVTEALAAGRCYASTGPTIEDFRLSRDPESPTGWRASARFSPAREVWFVSNAFTGQAYLVPAEKPEVTEMAHQVKVGAEYVRLVVVDERGRRAWSGPLEVPGAADS
jgi:hypothetical protein